MENTIKQNVVNKLLKPQYLYTETPLGDNMEPDAVSNNTNTSNYSALNRSPNFGRRSALKNSQSEAFVLGETTKRSFYQEPARESNALFR